jgi:hypothetical protein
MAAAKAKKGVMVAVEVVHPLNYNGDDYAIGETLEIDESGLQQLIDVGAVTRVEDSAGEASA